MDSPKASLATLFMNNKDVRNEHLPEVLTNYWREVAQQKKLQEQGGGQDLRGEAKARRAPCFLFLV